MNGAKVRASRVQSNGRRPPATADISTFCTTTDVFARPWLAQAGRSDHLGPSASLALANLARCLVGMANRRGSDDSCPVHRLNGVFPRDGSRPAVRTRPEQTDRVSNAARADDVNPATDLHATILPLAHYRTVNGWLDIDGDESRRFPGRHALSRMANQSCARSKDLQRVEVMVG